MTKKPKQEYNFPALNTYITRIGGQLLNFKRIMVKEYKGSYYFERSLIRISQDGTITADDQNYAPTEAEAKAIKESIKNIDWPKHISASKPQIDKLRKTLDRESTLYAFRDDNGTFIMAQERANLPDRGKAYIPWTYYSDGEWRRMEPESKLPFWRPVVNDKIKIMIHEGAKSAAYITEHLDDPDWIHPWRNDLIKYQHWGMIGGALAPHRTDYKMLHAASPKEVIYVCDNDWPGNAALQEVARHYGASIKGMRFDKKFPESWDLADQMPKEFFNDASEYIGPDMHAFTNYPATYATVKKPGAKNYSLTDHFKQEWIQTVKPEFFIHIDDPSYMLDAKQFNSTVSPFSDVDDTARLMRADATCKGAELKYAPDHTSGLYTETGTRRRCMNTYVPSRIKAINLNTTPWTKFLENLFPDKIDRIEVMRWIATLIARPDIRMKYGILAISETQGVGKTTLGDILSQLVGRDNTAFPGEAQIVDSNYNSWAAHKRLIVVNEIYSGHSARAYNALKTLITDHTITVNTKYVMEYKIDNWTHWYACSNSLRALQLTGDDRRWLVPKVSEKKMHSIWWEDFYDWLEKKRGLNAIMYWAHDWVKHNENVQAGAEAPWTVAKGRVVEEGRSPGLTFVYNLLELITQSEEYKNSDWFVIDTHLVKAIKDIVNEGKNTGHLERASTIRKEVKTMGLGLFIGDQRVRSDASGWGLRGTSSFIIANNKADTDTDPRVLVASGRRPVDVFKVASGIAI